jgi:hypothetical protein
MGSSSSDITFRIFKLIKDLLLLMIIEGDENDTLYVQTNAETL